VYLKHSGDEQTKKKAGAFAFVSLYQQTQHKDGKEELQNTAQARI